MRGAIADHPCVDWRRNDGCFSRRYGCDYHHRRRCTARRLGFFVSSNVEKRYLASYYRTHRSAGADETRGVV